MSTKQQKKPTKYPILRRVQNSSQNIRVLDGRFKIPQRTSRQQQTTQTLQLAVVANQVKVGPIICGP